MYRLVASLVLTLAMVAGCAGHDQATGTSSSPPSDPPAPSPSALVSPPPAAGDAQAVIAYLLLPDDAGQGRYAGWKKSQTLDGAAKHLSLCSTHDSKEIISDAKVDFLTSKVAQYKDDNALNVIVESVVVMTSGSGPEIAKRKRGYDGDCPAGNTTALVSGFSAPQDFPDAKAFCSHPLPANQSLIRCSTALGRGHVYVQLEVDAIREADAAANLSRALAVVASHLAQLPA